MFTPTRPRRLIIPLGDRELTVAVQDDAAVLEIASVVTDADDAPDPLRLRVPARALVAALRVAWADEHDLRCFEPWRDVTRDGWWRGYEPVEDHDYLGPTRWYDDLGDGDPGGYRDPTVVPFPRPPVPPRPARSGQPWEREEEDELRDLWLAASPEADRAEVLRQVAGALERGVGGITVRLPAVGCDPRRPGRRRDDPDDPEPVDLDGDLTRAAAAPSGCS